MGFRSRIKQRLQRTAGAPAPDETRTQRAAPPATARPSVQVAAPRAAVPESQAEPQKPQTPAPKPPPPDSVSPQAPIGLSQLLESDYASDDAPVRNAHYAGEFETTTQAVSVRVFSQTEGIDVSFSCEPGEFVLDAAERAGHELPFSCRSGGCLSCSAHLKGGDTDMDEQYVLDQQHLDDGYRLLCLTKVTSPCTFESHVQDDID